MPRNDDHFDDFDDEDDGFMTFDARGEDEGVAKGPIILAAIVLLAAVALAFVWVYFNGNKSNKDATPEIAAQSETFKEEPLNAVGNSVDGLDNSALNGVDGATELPPLEVEPVGGATTDPLVDQTQVAPPVTTTNTVASKPVTVPKPVVTAKPVEKPVAKPVAKPVEKPKPVATKTAEVAKPVAKPVEKPKTETKTVSSGGSAAQLGSFPTKEQADKALAEYRGKGLTGPVSIVSADLGAKGTWYRIRATGFESREQALSFCSKAKAAGANCIPSK